MLLQVGHGRVSDAREVLRRLRVYSTPDEVTAELEGIEAAVNEAADVAEARGSVCSRARFLVLNPCACHLKLLIPCAQLCPATMNALEQTDGVTLVILSCVECC